MYCAIVRFLLTQYTFCYSKNPDDENDEGDEEEEESDENSDEDGGQTTRKSGLFDSDSEGEDVNDVLGRAKPQDKSSYEKRQEKVGYSQKKCYTGDSYQFSWIENNQYSFSLQWKQKNPTILTNIRNIGKDKYYQIIHVIGQLLLLD